MVDGADLLSTQEDSTHAQYIGKEREVFEQDHHRIPIPIHFVENETVEMVSTNDGTTLIERIPNEILEKILSENLLYSGSRGLMMYAVCTITYVKSTSLFESSDSGGVGLDLGFRGLGWFIILKIF